MGDTECFKKKMLWVNPANMIKIDIDISPDILLDTEVLEVSLDDS